MNKFPESSEFEELGEDPALEPERYEFTEPDSYRFEVDRRQFVQLLGAGLILTVSAASRAAEGPRRRLVLGGRPLDTRLHIGADGKVTVMTGKVEVGQGARTQIAQAAAEELGLPLSDIRMMMADTAVTPNDGGTFGSLTTPVTIPRVRHACAAAGDVLRGIAARHFGVEANTLRLESGRVVSADGRHSITFGELISLEGAGEALKGNITDEVSVKAVGEWKVLGTGAQNANRTSIVTGAHRYPSDMRLPDTLYGAVLRAPSYGAKLVSVDLATASAMEGVTVVHDEEFVGCAAPTSAEARRAVETIAATARWDQPAHPSSRRLFNVLRENAQTDPNVRRNKPRVAEHGDVTSALAGSSRKFRSTFNVPYIQHVPMEPRAALAHWESGEVTVWAGTQNPGRVRSQVARAFSISSKKVRVIVPDTGGGFGGKHTGECSVEASRLAKAAGRPVSLTWTREEEFTWAYFRPAGVIDIDAVLGDDGKIAAWDFRNFNSGTSAIETPYAIPNVRTTFYFCDSPLREGSYRSLAAAANTFAREAMMDELAVAVGEDPLAFRLRHIQEPRLRDVLLRATEAFGWEEKSGQGSGTSGIGLSCGTDKGSYVAACVEIEVDPGSASPKIKRIVQAFECGAIQNPLNLRAQVEGAIIMGLGGALTEEIEFEGGKILNASLSTYPVPRIADVPEIETILVDRPDIDSAGAGETPIIAIAPAVANAMARATGERVRALPLRYGA